MTNEHLAYKGELAMRLTAGRIVDEAPVRGGNTWQVNTYPLAEILLPEDISNPLFQKLSRNYADQLLLPNFQENPLYQDVNMLAANRPKYDYGKAAEEVAEYSGINGDFIDPVFLLYDSIGHPPFERLVGYTIGFGLQEGVGISDLFYTKLDAGVAGNPSDDAVDVVADLDEIDATSGKTAYFSGVATSGTHEEIQSAGFGIFLMRRFFEEYSNKGYQSMVSRVKRGAKNWSLFAGIDEKQETSITGTVPICWYSSDTRGSNYRGVFLNDIPQTIQFLDGLIEKRRATS